MEEMNNYFGKESQRYHLHRFFKKVYEMLEAKTNCSFLSLMSLVSYGNWCGPGSNGKDPVDDVDACCQVNPSSHYSAKL